MAKMIPSNISQEQARKSPAEADVFGWLREMKWGDAIVLYSLPLKDHIKKSFGEIDFVFICEKGVLCIEVKGGYVERKNGEWIFTKRSGGEPDKKVEGPYTQVQGNMKSLRTYLSKHLPTGDPILSCRFASCVMTPDCVIKSDSDTEIIPEITYNINMKPIDIPKIFERSFNYWEKEKHYGGSCDLSMRDRERLATFLRGDFCFVPPLNTLLKRTEEQLVSVTNEQLEIIMRMNVNARMLVEGGAGTGKTLLAMEQCRRATIKGEKVLYLCFNYLIAAYVRETFAKEELSKAIDVFTFHDLLMDICDVQTVPEDEEAFFKTTLPDMFMTLSTSKNNEIRKYDRIIMDEGQDLMNTTSYLCINELIKGGWDKGKWTIYYDPNQNIFGENEEFVEVWEALQDSAFTYPLTVNCRNTRQIAQGNYEVTLVYKPEVMRAEGEDIVYYPYKSKKEEAQHLFEEIRRLKAEGLSKKDIVILSYYRMDNPKSCLFGENIPTDIGNILFNSKSGFDSCNTIRYYTIQTYKGMESKAVIMVDVDSLSDKDKVLLNYVGMSRAKTYLEFFFDSSLKEERQQRLVKAIITQ